jgi:hypothetical protein
MSYREIYREIVRRFGALSGGDRTRADASRAESTYRKDESGERSPSSNRDLKSLGTKSHAGSIPAPSMPKLFDRWPHLFPVPSRQAQRELRAFARRAIQGKLAFHASGQIAAY